MARIKNGITGNPSGKIGNVIASSWKGIPYIKSRPAKVKQPNTEKQMAQRMRMSKVLEFVKPLKAFLNIGFGAYAVHKSAYNVAMSVNMKNALTGTYPDIHIDYSKALVSMGNLPAADQAKASFVEPGTIKISWQPNSSEYTASPADKAIVVICNPVINKAFFNLDSAQRSDGEAFINIPENFIFEDVKCYLSFARKLYLEGRVSERGVSESRFCFI